MAVRILAGDCRLRLAELPAGSVHCCVTSPPYYGLRSYQCEPQVWGGKPDCEHEVTVSERGLNNRHAIALLRGDEGTEKGGTANHRDFRLFDATCIHCGAWVGELGLEPTVELYLAHLLEVFAAVRRTMRDDATLWVNLGSSYGPGGQELQVPARFALAMQGAGWLLRSAIVLAKAAPMPESVTGTQWVRCRVKVKAKELTGTRKAVHAPQHSNNVPLPGADAEYSPCPGCAKCADTQGMVLRWGMGRPTSAYEYLFLFSKGGRYFYNSEAVRMPPNGDHAQRRQTPHGFGRGDYQQNGVRPPREEVLPDSNPAGANARNVLAWKPEPLKEGHYAAFPSFIPMFAIKAGTAEQVCGECGAPYAPVIEQGEALDLPGFRTGRGYTDYAALKPERIAANRQPQAFAKVVQSHRPTCRCQERVCSSCGLVIESSYARGTSTTNRHVRDLSKGVQARQAREDVLQPGLLPRGDEAGSSGEAVRAVRPIVPGQSEPDALLQQGLLDQMDRQPPAEHPGMVSDHPGLHPHLRPGASERLEDGVCDAASSGDGREVGTSNPVAGSRSPQERREGRQPAGEPRSDAEAASRRDEEAPVYRDVSPLPPGVSDAGQCPHCAGEVVSRPPPSAPSVVLDCFCGSGTTLMVAERLGRDAVGVDLQPDYVAIAERRASADAGLFGEVSVCEGLPESNGHAQLAWEW